MTSISRLLLLKKSEGSIEKWYNFYRMLDWTIMVYLRFNGIHKKSLIHNFYYALSLFSVDHLEFDLVYMLVKVLLSDKIVENK